MARASELARLLVEYDERVAARVLAALCEAIGGPAAGDDLDLRRLRAFLARPDLRQAAAVDDPQTTTAEWKTELGHYEATRTLAAELVERLDR